MIYQPYNYSFPKFEENLSMSYIFSNAPLNLVDTESFPESNILDRDGMYQSEFFDLDYSNITFQNTDSLFSGLISKKLFETKKFKKKGRPAPENFLGKKHGKANFDNILTKVQVHFITFLVNLINDAVKHEFAPEFLNTLVKKDNKKSSKYNFFKQPNYADKRKIKYSYINEFLQKPIREIFQFNISTKYRNLKFDYNKELYAKLSEKSEWFSDLLNTEFIKVFLEYYYNQGNKLETIDFKGKSFKISDDTKSFYYLLKKEESLKQDMINIVKAVYLNKVNNKNNDEKHFILDKLIK